MVIDEVTAFPFMSWGDWVALCPRPGCYNAEKRGVCDDGSLGGLEAGRFHCREQRRGCGLTCAVTWPPDLEAIEAALFARPLRMSRNWVPGELVNDLLRENIEHGIDDNEHLLKVAFLLAGPQMKELTDGLG